MKRRLFLTNDGSHSITIDDLHESYHSHNGSIQEGRHNFIKSGADYYKQHFNPSSITVFELGFGTGLNALLLYQWYLKNSISVSYHGLEAFPLEKELWLPLNYAEQLGLEKQVHEQLHECSWNSKMMLDDRFEFLKTDQKMVDYSFAKTYDLVFYDAFAPSVQPDLWTYAQFQKVYNAMNYKGVLVTYSAAGKVRRALSKAGFWIDEIRGAPGKREMTRALKL